MWSKPDTCSYKDKTVAHTHLWQQRNLTRKKNSYPSAPDAYFSMNDTRVAYFGHPQTKILVP